MAAQGRHGCIPPSRPARRRRVVSGPSRRDARRRGPEEGGGAWKGERDLPLGSGVSSHRGWILRLAMTLNNTLGWGDEDLIISASNSFCRPHGPQSARRRLVRVPVRGRRKLLPLHHLAAFPAAAASGAAAAERDGALTFSSSDHGRGGSSITSVEAKGRKAVRES